MSLTRLFPCSLISRLQPVLLHRRLWRNGRCPSSRLTAATAAKDSQRQLANSKCKVSSQTVPDLRQLPQFHLNSNNSIYFNRFFPITNNNPSSSRIILNSSSSPIHNSLAIIHPWAAEATKWSSSTLATRNSNSSRME